MNVGNMMNKTGNGLTEKMFLTKFNNCLKSQPERAILSWIKA